MAIRLADKNSLAGKASRAFGWSFFSTFLTRLGTFGIGVLLARLLGPHAFGIYAVAFVALLAMQTFNELGVSLAIVRWEGDPKGILPTVTTVSVSVSAAIYVCCFFAAPYYAAAMGVPAAAGVVRLLAIAILIDGFANAPSGLLQRNFRQGQSMIAVQAGGWVGTGVTLALAWLRYGAMSLAIGQVVGAMACATLLILFVPESLRFGFDRAKAHALLRFGLPLAGSNLVSLAITSVDQIVVGHMLGAKWLGFYVLALNLAGWPISMFSQPVTNVAPAVFSRLQHDRAAMRNTFLSVAGLLAAVALPACLLIGGTAKPLIGFVYGAHWLPAARPLLWLSLLAAVRIFSILAYDYLVVLRRSRFLLVVQLIWLGALIPALVAGTRFCGIYGTGLMEAAIAAFVVFPCYLGGLRRDGINLRTLSGRLWLPAAGALGVWLMTLETAKLAPNYFTAIAASSIGMVVVVAFLTYRSRAVIALFKPTSAEDPENHTVIAQHESAVQAATSPDDIVAQLTTTQGPIGAQLIRMHKRMVTGPSRQDVLPGRAQPDITGSLPVNHDALGYISWQRLDATSPLYRITATSLRWDPSSPVRRTRSLRESISSPSGEPSDNPPLRMDRAHSQEPPPSYAGPHGNPTKPSELASCSSTGIDLLLGLSQPSGHEQLNRNLHEGSNHDH